MVKVRAALSSEHSRLVELESRLAGLDGDGHRLLGQGTHHGAVRVGHQVGEALRSSVGVLRNSGVASASLLGLARHIRIVSLGGDAAPGLGPTESGIHEATVAAQISATVLDGVTVYEHLLGERNKLSVLDLVGTLDSAGGGERPAGTARSLVLDTGHGTLSRPVDRLGKSRHIGGGSVQLGSDVGGVLLEAEVHSLSPLLHSHVGEFVVAELVSGVQLVVSLNNIVIVGEGSNLSGGTSVTLPTKCGTLSEVTKSVNSDKCVLRFFTDTIWKGLLLRTGNYGLAQCIR